MGLLLGLLTSSSHLHVTTEKLSNAYLHKLLRWQKIERSWFSHTLQLVHNISHIGPPLQCSLNQKLTLLKHSHLQKSLLMSFQEENAKFGSPSVLTIFHSNGFAKNLILSLTIFGSLPRVGRIWKCAWPDLSATSAGMRPQTTFMIYETNRYTNLYTQVASSMIWWPIMIFAPCFLWSFTPSPYHFCRGQQPSWSSACKRASPSSCLWLHESCSSVHMESFFPTQTGSAFVWNTTPGPKPGSHVQNLGTTRFYVLPGLRRKSTKSRRPCLRGYLVTPCISHLGII